MDVVQIISNLGLPAGLLIVVMVAMVKVAKFSAPLMTALVEKHIEWIEANKLQMESQTEILQSIENVQESHNGILESNTEILKQIHNSLEKK